MRTYYKFFLFHSARSQETMYWYCDDKRFKNKDEIVAECVRQGYLCPVFAPCVTAVWEVSQAEYLETMYED
jgi:hypothetical protein